MKDRISPTTARPPQGEIRTIQYLRAVAALGVLAFHLAERAGGAFGAGAAGVDLFFVISGFIMWTVTARKPISPGEFILKRVQRIVPLYWAVTLAVAGTAILIPGAFPALSPSLETVWKSLLFIPHRDAAGLIAPLVVPGWTLNYEMFFYVIFGLALLVRPSLRPWLVTAVLAGFVAVRPLGDVSNPLWATYTNPLLLEFAAGMWLGKAWSEGRLPGLRSGWIMLALGLFLFGVVGVAGIDVERARAIYWGIPAFLVVSGAVTLERARAIPQWPPLRALGDASFSLYLLHGLAISATVRLLQAMDLASPTIIWVAGLAASLCVGLIAYQIVEKPLARKLGSRPETSRQVRQQSHLS